MQKGAAGRKERYSAPTRLRSHGSARLESCRLLGHGLFPVFPVHIIFAIHALNLVHHLEPSTRCVDSTAVCIMRKDLLCQTNVPATHFGIKRGIPHVEATLEPSKVDVTFLVKHHEHLDGALSAVRAHDHNLVFFGIGKHGLDLLEEPRVRILLVDLGFRFGVPSAGQAEQRHVFGERDPAAIAAFVVGSDVQNLVAQVLHQHACFVGICNSFFFHRLLDLFHVLDGIRDGGVLAEVSRGGRLRPRGSRASHAPRTCEVRPDGRCRTGQHRSARLPRCASVRASFAAANGAVSRGAHVLHHFVLLDEDRTSGPHVLGWRDPLRYMDPPHRDLREWIPAEGWTGTVWRRGPASTVLGRGESDTVKGDDIPFEPGSSPLSIEDIPFQTPTFEPDPFGSTHPEAPFEDRERPFENRNPCGP